MNIFKIVTHHEFPEKAIQIYVEDGIIAIGFDIGDPGQKNRNELKTLFMDLWDLSTARASVAASQLLRFRDEVHVGDIILAYLTGNIVGRIGEVISNHEYNTKNRVGTPDGELRYPNQRKIKWWDRPRNFNRKLLQEPLKTRVALPRTIGVCSEDYSIDKLVEELKASGLQVKSDNSSRARARFESEIVSLLKNKLDKDGYSIKTHVDIYKNIEADLLAEKNGKKHLFEIKITKNGIISGLINRQYLISLPDISFISFAFPNEFMSDEIVKIAQKIGFGIYSISPNEVKTISQPTELPLGEFKLGGGSSSIAIPGKTTQVQQHFYAYNKIIANAVVSYPPGGPFFVPEGESNIKIFDMSPLETTTVEFNIGIRKNAKPGIYSLYLICSGSGMEYINYFDIKIQEETEDNIINEVNRSRDTLNYAIDTNLENILQKIDEGITKGILTYQKNVFKEPIWDRIGGFCFQRRLFPQAELIYKRMLESTKKLEIQQNKRLHKGHSFYNLGIALYSQGKTSEAKENILQAYQEDITTFGQHEADNLPAKKILTQLFDLTSSIE